MTTVLERFSAQEREIMLKAMRATAVYIGESEIHTRLGVDASEFANVIALWPKVDLEIKDGNEFLAVHNSLNEVCHGFRIKDSEWSQWFDVPMSKVVAVYRKWLVVTDVCGGIR